ncbi:hypothetical protein ACLOJK_036259 [Asimina triloba]
MQQVKKVKPHVLLGLSGVGGIFNEEASILTLEPFSTALCAKFGKFDVNQFGFSGNYLRPWCKQYFSFDCVPNPGAYLIDVLKAMRESDSPRPAIFAMSNPTMNAECTAADAFKYAGDNIVFASGSPFQNVDLGNGKVGHVNQANNMYLFPGIGLGALLSGAHFISDGMLQAAAECVSMTPPSSNKEHFFHLGYVWCQIPSTRDVTKPPSKFNNDFLVNSNDGAVFRHQQSKGVASLEISKEPPEFKLIRHITAQVGAAVVRAAVAEELAEGHGELGMKELLHMSQEETVDYVARSMWYPVYSPLVHEK